MKITLIRHGRTIGNVKGCFNGVTNDPLCDEGVEIIKEYVEKGIYPEVGIVVSSPLKRCLQTSNLRWIESNGTSDIPNGESFNAFTDRCVKGFKEAVDISKNNLNSAFVIHGGTMMALLTALTGENFYTTVPKNGLGFVINWENNEVKDLKTLV